MVIRSTIVKVFLTIFFSCAVWHNANADVGGFYVVDDYVVDAVLQSENISEQDLQIYQQMFESIEKQRFYKLEKLEKKLQNKILWGNVLAEQYLSKTYPSKFVQLKKWLEKYADLPYAQRIYKLAKKKSKGKQNHKMSVWQRPDGTPLRSQVENKEKGPQRLPTAIGKQPSKFAVRFFLIFLPMFSCRSWVFCNRPTCCFVRFPF